MEREVQGRRRQTIREAVKLKKPRRLSIRKKPEKSKEKSLVAS